ncbi:MAG: hypothetical protein H7336_05485 [Bacteriovorax sp.]|nr:hypothetical protein [Bacteriovorax sp.]
MTWSRTNSELEPLMVKVLKKKNVSLSLQEIVLEIIKLSPDVFTGSTPRNSLYSVIYRREKRRASLKKESLFIRKECRGEVLYSINKKYLENK